VALGAGIVALIRDKAILPATLTGKIYVITTILTCITGFGIFQHGGFGKPHALGVITLVVLGIAAAAGSSSFGKASPYIALVSYSLTFFFHLVPGITETVTRLPLGSPWVANAEAPELQKAIGAVFVVFLIGVILQVLRLRVTIRLGAKPVDLQPSLRAVR
jgi:uncharacterized membrane protein